VTDEYPKKRGSVPLSNAWHSACAYGLNENKANDARYVEAYRSCMKGRGYVG
jgi:hypothetical protein